MTFNDSRKGRVAWGKVRDALAAVHNLETLLKSPRVNASVLKGLLPELHASCVALRAAFEEQPPGVARAVLGKFALERLDSLEQAMKEADAAAIEVRARLALEHVVARVSGELDASVELLDLIERAESATPTELSLEELARASLGIGAGIGHGVAATVRVDTHDADCMLVADAHVVSRLVAAAVARIRGSAAHDVTVRTRCEAREVVFEVATSDKSSATLAAVQAHLAARIPPTDVVVEEVARAIGGTIAVSDRRVVLSLPRG